MECGALLELDGIRIPFAEGDKKKKFRRAIFIVARVGHKVESSELLTFGQGVTEIVIPNKLRFTDVSPAFKLCVEIYGMELPEKEKLKGIDPNAKFTIWGTLNLSAKDMINASCRKNYEISYNAPTLPVIFGMIDIRLCGAVPALCDTIQEGYLSIWQENETRLWNMFFVKIRNGKIHLYDGKDKKYLSQIDFSDDIKVCESTRQRDHSFQIRYQNQRTVFAASCGEEMQQWIRSIRRHKEHLKEWGRLKKIDQVQDTSDGMMSAFFSGNSKVTVIKSARPINKRRSRSVDIKSPVKNDRLFQRYVLLFPALFLIHPTIMVNCMFIL